MTTQPSKTSCFLSLYLVCETNDSSDDRDYESPDTLTNKIAAWGGMLVYIPPI